MYGILCTKYFLLKSTTGMCPLESAKNCVKFMLTPPLTFKLFPSTFLLLDSTEIIVKTKQCQTREILTSSLAVKGEVEKWSIASIYKSYINLKGFGSPKDCGDQIKIESPQIWIWVLAVVEIVPVVALFLCIFLPLAVLTQKLMELVISPSACLKNMTCDSKHWYLIRQPSFLCGLHT